MNTDPLKKLFEILNVKFINNTSNNRIRKIDYQKKENIYFYSDMKAINNYLRFKFVLCVQGIVNLKCLLIEFVIPNLSHIFFFIQKPLKRIFKTSF